jgi:hypothetical protein
MSQLASGFVLAPLVLAEAAVAATQRNGAAMARALAPHAVPPFAFSGYVVAVLVEWLRESGAPPPVSAAADLAPLVAFADPLLMADDDTLAAFRAALDRLALEDAARLRFWQEWTGDETEDAAEALRAGWAWIAALAEAAGPGQWALLLEG